MNNRDRIIEKALQLFSQHGYHNVTTKDICHKLTISPGNLYYHFRSKDDILNAILEEYDKDISNITYSDASNYQFIPLLKSYLNVAFSLMWKYRFLSIDIPYCLRIASPQSTKFQEISAKLTDFIDALFSRLESENVLDFKNSSRENLIVNTMLLFHGWETLLLTEKPYQQIDEKDCHAAILHLLEMFLLFATPQGVVLITMLKKLVAQGFTDFLHFAPTEAKKNDLSV